MRAYHAPRLARLRFRNGAVAADLPFDWGARETYHAVVFSDVLRYIDALGGAPITEIRTAFDLPSEFVANLCLQLQDAGYLEDPILEACHHQEPGGSCESCSGGNCASSHAPTNFGVGCCGMNAPYQVTILGRDYLRTLAEATGGSVPLGEFAQSPPPAPLRGNRVQENWIRDHVAKLKAASHLRETFAQTHWPEPENTRSH